MALPKQSHHQMIIIGALDECEDHEPIQQLITFTASVDYFKFPVNFLFTSRREERIHKSFEFPSVNYMPYHISLSNTTLNVHGDIKHFLWSQFSIIYQQNLWLMQNISPLWPLPSDLDEIVQKVNGSFIFASTLTKYIGEGMVSPHRLRLMVESYNGVDNL